MRALRVSAGVLAVVTTLAVSGCGGDGADPAEASGSASSSPTASDEPTREHEKHGKDDDPSAEQPTAPTEPPEDNAVEVEVEIEGGEVNPTGEQVDANVGDGVVLQVDSNIAEELHVHTAPVEHQYVVRAADDQAFRFTVEQPGQFDVELHESGVLVAQLVVRP